MTTEKIIKKFLIPVDEDGYPLHQVPDEVAIQEITSAIPLWAEIELEVKK